MTKRKPIPASAVLVPFAFVSPILFAAEQPAREVLEEVLVTGSYIKGSPTDAPSPVQVLNRETMDQQGAASVFDVIKNLGVNQGSTTNDDQGAENGTISGTANVNLRNLGTNSTLTLINGKRQVAAAVLTADGSEFVDLNAIPQIMIDRIEVLTDGGSALYGSDAIAGVVNNIMRTQFEGIEVSARYLRLDGGDHPDDKTFGAIWGIPFNNGRTHLVIGGEYVKREPVKLTDVPHYDPSRTQFYGELSNITPIGPGVNASFNGYLNAANTALRTMRNNSATPLNEFTDPRCAQVGGIVGDVVNQPFDNPDSRCVENTTRFAYVSVSEERKNAALAFNHEFSDAFKAYSFFQYAHNDIGRADAGALSSLGPAIILPVGSATNGLGSRSGQPLPNPTNAPNTVANGGLGSIALADYDLLIPRQGANNNTNETETYGGQIGLKGDFSIGDREFGYDVSYVHSQNSTLRKDRTLVRDRAELAMNGLGGPNCTPNGITTFNLNADPYFGNLGLQPVFFREYSPGYPQNLRETVSLAVTSTNQGQGGCMFLNPFLTALTNPALANSQQLIDWLSPVVPTSDRENKLDVADAVVTGDLFDLSGGKSRFAFGLQYRKQHNVGRSYSLVEPGLQTIVSYNPLTYRYASNDNQYGGFFTRSFDDTRNIKAAFTEFSLPFIKSIETQLAVRFEDYGGAIGSEVSPKLAVRWKPIDPLAFRASFSQSFRAPNTGVVFNGVGANASAVKDRIARQDVRAGLAEPTYANSNNVGVFDRGLAAPDLKAETADTYNFGVIFKLAGVNLTVDYWRFDVKDRVVSQPLPNALEPELARFLQARANPANYVRFDSLPFTAPTRYIACDPRTLAAGSPERLNCVVDPRTYITPGVDRGPDTGQLITVDTHAVNAGRILTDGIDFHVDYSFETGIGQFLSALDYTHVFQYEISNLPGFDQGFFGTGITDAAGTTGDGVLVRSQPDNKANLGLTWLRKGHSVTAIVRYIGSYDDLAYDNVVANAEQARIALASRTVDSHTTLDLQYNYTLDWNGKFGSTRLTLGALNVTDEAAPFRVAAGLDYDSTVVDPRGRRYYIQLVQSF